MTFLRAVTRTLPQQNQAAKENTNVSKAMLNKSKHTSVSPHLSRQRELLLASPASVPAKRPLLDGAETCTSFFDVFPLHAVSWKTLLTIWY